MMRQLSEDAVRAHLDRLVADARFANAERMCRFLRFTVESRLCGKEDQVKEYVLGREVFDRREDYDPRLDPIVRVEARRLRAKLSDYYAGPGRDEPLRIDYPKGTYLPVISARSEPTATALRRLAPSQRNAVLTAVAIIVAAAAAFLQHATTPGPLIAVVPVRWISGDVADLDPADAGVSEALAIELANRHLARVVAWPELLRYSSGRQTFAAIASGVGAAQLLLVSVRRESPLLVTVFVVDAGSGQKIRANRYERSTLATFASQRALAAQIARDLSGRKGPRSLGSL